MGTLKSEGLGKGWRQGKEPTEKLNYTQSLTCTPDVSTVRHVTTPIAYTYLPWVPTANVDTWKAA